MIAMFVLATAPLVDLFQEARDEIRVASPSVFEPRVIRSIGVGTSHGARASVVLAPEAGVARMDGRTYVGSDPYAAAEPEFVALKKARAEIFIDPRYSNAGATTSHEGRRSSMSFAVIGTPNLGKVLSVICTGAMSTESMVSQRNVCVKMNDTRIHAALSHLHHAVVDDTAAAEVRTKLEKQARDALVISPGATPAIAGLFDGCKTQTVRVITDEIDLTGQVGKALLNCGPQVTLTLPPSYRPDATVITALEQKGVMVAAAPANFSGTMIFANGKVFVGSLSLTAKAMERDRNVGIAFPVEKSENIAILGGAK